MARGGLTFLPTHAHEKGHSEVSDGDLGVVGHAGLERQGGETIISQDARMAPGKKNNGDIPPVVARGRLA